MGWGCGITKEERRDGFNEDMAGGKVGREKEVKRGKEVGRG